MFKFLEQIKKNKVGTKTLFELMIKVREKRIDMEEQIDRLEKENIESKRTLDMAVQVLKGVLEHFDLGWERRIELDTINFDTSRCTDSTAPTRRVVKVFKKQNKNALQTKKTKKA